MGNESLRDAVEAQARAWVAGDLATFASYTTPRVVLDLRDGDMNGATGYRLLELNEAASTGASKVHLTGRREFVLDQRWQLIDGLWKVVHAESLDAPSMPWWRRLLRRGGASPEPPSAP